MAYSMTLLLLIFVFIIFYFILVYDKTFFISPSPGLVTVFVYLAYYIFPSFATLIFPDFRPNPFPDYFADSSYQYVVILALSWITSFYIFYYLFCHLKINFTFKTNFRPVRVFNKLSPSFVVIASLILFVVYLILTSLKYSLGYVHYGGSLTVYEKTTSSISRFITIGIDVCGLANSALIYLLAFNKLTSSYKILSYLIISGFVISFLSTGGASTLISIFLTPILIVFVFKLYARRTPIYSIIWLKFIVFIIISIALAFFFKSLTRLTLYGYSPYDLSISFTQVFDLISISFRDISYSLLGADTLNLIISKISSGAQDYFPMLSISTFLFGALPRFLFPNKPDIALGMWFTDNFYRTPTEVLIAGEGTQGTAFLPLGESYFNFGVFGLIPFSFILAFLLALYYRYLFKRSCESLSYFISSSFLFWPIVHHIYSLPSLIYGTISRMFVLIVFFILTLLLLSFVRLFSPKAF